MEANKTLKMKSIEGEFMLNDFSTTHNQFLFRQSQYNEDSGELRNKDILIEGVCYVNLPLRFDGFQIVDVMENNVTEDSSKMIFYINDKERNWFIIGDRILYQENSLNWNETSIPCKKDSNSDINISDLEKIVDDYIAGKIPDWNVNNDWERLW